MSRSNVIAVVCILTALSLTCWTSPADATDGLYISNATDILFFSDPLNANSQPVSVYKSEYGRIVGLAYDLPNKLLFWSNIDVLLKGIYQASIDTDGSLFHVTTLVSTDIMEVNCLTVDWMSHNLYWTDGRKKTIEVINYKSTKYPLPRRVLIMDGLLAPRGIYADPINGYLFWNDQGQNTIERSMLDGTYRTRIFSGTTWPNQMVVNAQSLYWVDSYSMTFFKTDLNGQNPILTTSLALKVANIFGLAIINGSALITNWNRQLIVVNIGTSAVNLLRSVPGSDSLFSAVFYSASVQLAGTSNCSTASCSHLCLPTSKTNVRCSCPSFGGLVLRASSNTSCLNIAGSLPVNVLLYALADSGYVGYYDPLSPPIQPPFFGSRSISGERYLVGRSLRPVGVAYDPVQSMVYWSDVSERTIHKAHMDGSNQTLFLGSAQGIGVVDGMVLDSLHRQLYYTNIGSVTVDGSVYVWNKIETIGLDPPYKIRTIVSTAEQPRALALDFTAGYIYYTDWGNRARVVRTNLDGTQPKELRSGLNNPNGLALANGRVYYTDSNYKTRQNVNYPGPSRNGSLYSMSAVDGSGWKDELMGNFQLATPYGLSYDSENTLYISDWDLQVVLSLNIHNSTTQVILDNVQSPMMLVYTQPNATGANVCGVSSCGDICLSTPTNTAVCTCSSYSTEALAFNSRVCNKNSVGFIVVGDMNSLKQYSLDGIDMSVYTASQGIPFRANIVGVAYDSLTKTTYYSDVTTKWIMSMASGSNATQYFQINNIIDGMTVDVVNRRLFWTDAMFNQILYLNFTNDGYSLPDNYGVVITNLSKPRAIKIYAGFLYWTEWGDTATYRVSKLDLSQLGSQSAQRIGVLSRSNTVINWANGLFFDEINARMYVADGHPQTKRVLNCSLSQDPTSCQELTGLTPTLLHIYDIWVYNNIVYYSDWKSAAVIAYSVAQNTSWPILQALMRPSQMLIMINPSYNNSCAANLGPANGLSTCVPVLGGPSWACNASKTLSADDQKTCVNSALQCSNTTATYSQTFLPSAEICVDCQCLQNSTRFQDIVYGAGKCNRYGACPSLVCGGDGSTKVGNNQCCPVCVTSCTLKITNCPTLQINLTLPDDQPSVVYDYLPSVRDCTGLSREIQLMRSPPGAVYSWNSSVQTVTVTASVVSGGSDSGSCVYYIRVYDVTPPTLTCPLNVILYSSGTTAVGIWNAPAVSDNSGNVQPYYPNPSWGSALPIGNTTVSYVVKDYSNNVATCSFTVTIVKTESQKCLVPSLNNGQLLCGVSSGDFTCTIQCDKNYRNTLSSGTITCSNGQWSPTMNSFQISTCIRPGPKAASGNITAIGRNACGPNIRLQYTEEFIQAKIIERYLWLSTFVLTSTTRATGCAGQAAPRTKRDVSAAGVNDVQVVVVISGVYYYDGDLQNLIADIDAILQLIYDDLNRSFLILTYLDGNGVHTTLHPEVQILPAVPGCLEGTILLSDGLCGLCPTGMFTKDRVRCYPCSSDTYNEQEAQTQCPPCPYGGTSVEGAYIRYLCQNKTTPTGGSGCQTPCIIGLVVGLGGGLLLLFVIIIVLVVLLRRRRSTSNNRRSSTVHVNEQYDEIVDDNTKEYEKSQRVSEVTNKNDQYDSLAKERPVTVVEKSPRSTIFP